MSMSLTTGRDEIVHVPTVANLDQHHHVEQEVIPLSCITTLQGGDRGVSSVGALRLLIHSPGPDPRPHDEHEPEQIVDQSSLYGESEPRVLREGCGYSSYTLGSGLYTPQNRNSMVRATPLQGRRPRPSSFGPPPPIHQITHLAGCPAVQIRRAHTWSASGACDGE